MQSMIISLLALCAAHDVMTLEKQKVPVIYVTEQNIVTAAKETNYFDIRLCGGCLYDDQIATVYINQPNKPWNIAVGDYEKVYVTDSSNNHIATNKDENDNDNFSDTFSFPYDKTYGDLRLKVVTGNAPAGVTYTITVRFAKNITVGQPVFWDKNNCQPRYYSTDQEIRKLGDFQKTVQGHTHELVTIFMTAKPGSVETQQAILLQLDYCFNTSSLPGIIAISVTATDAKSGFATYACPAHIRPCDTNSPFHDVSGAGVNGVVVNITQIESVGPVQILIRGDGRFEEYNKFTLSASKYFHGP